MDEFFKPINVVFLVLGIAAVILGVWAIAEGRKRKEPWWAVRNNILIEGYSTKLTGLTVMFDGAPVENLSVARVLFWNKGRETIRREDISAAEPICLRAVNDTKLLKVTLLAVNESANLFEEPTIVSQKEGLIKFDFIDRGQGAVFQVVHTGTSRDDIWMGGVIKGAEPLRRMALTRSEQVSEDRLRKSQTKVSRRQAQAIVLIFVMGLGLVSLLISALEWGAVLGWIPTLVRFSTTEEWSVQARYILPLVGLSYIFIGIYITVKNAGVRGLEAFTDDILS